MASDFKKSLTKEYIGIELWVIISIFLGVVCAVTMVISLWLTFRKKTKRNNMLPVSQRPKVSEKIKEISVDQNSANNGGFLNLHDRFSDKELEKVLIQLENGNDSSQSSSFTHFDKDVVGSQLGEEVSNVIDSSDERRIWASSVVESMVVETVVSAWKSLTCLFFVAGSSLNDINTSPKLIAIDERFSLDELLKKKHPHAENKDASDTKDDDEDEEDDENADLEKRYKILILRSKE